ncbi:hypothetical protein SAMCFNEI73_pB0503 (plasmid) [Sinorhizobium americanum]|uniref:Uncharacterized protein n=1 Tax=Sinorhizobium americanum TaxID=194963 RepID=A0A1L3LUD1_9HYPH|nr:hypothetical protein SAMCFNEI73_pB0503 [Sinorhizobium americanum]
MRTLKTFFGIESLTSSASVRKSWFGGGRRTVIGNSFLKKGG